ncbi:hypothetical protein SAMN05421747_11834 [Parapedobacter composti]|uniref:ABC-2 type transport system permease protein n=1 Tax=Parapedobacter composti TaxID=623281 RepID=A0A1I1L1P9_9SPHI|nr:hypothetical protein [Parapedobacter composti]SFC66969.1 hypothetical protein SAMN05421747_11834 [Parapedobacter composti]
MVFRNYFRLQVLMLNRRIEEAGVPFYVGYLIALVLFAGVSIGVFRLPDYPEYVYLVLLATVLAGMAHYEKHRYLVTALGAARTVQIRVLENLFASLPFAGFLAINGYFETCSASLLIGTASGFAKPRRITGGPLPTPFSKYPFEFPMGFRKYLPVLAGTYLLVAYACYADRFGLGLAMLTVLFFVCSAFYSPLEDRTYVWVHQCSPTAFLIKKIGTGLALCAAVTAPIAIALLIFFPEDVGWLCTVVLLGLLYLTAVIMAKYWAFPHEVNLMHVLVVSLVVWLPPLYLVFLPFLFQRSRRNLKQLLQ